MSGIASFALPLVFYRTAFVCHIHHNVLSPAYQQTSQSYHHLHTAYHEPVEANVTRWPPSTTSTLTYLPHLARAQWHRAASWPNIDGYHLGVLHRHGKHITNKQQSVDSSRSEQEEIHREHWKWTMWNPHQMNTRMAILYFIFTYWQCHSLFGTFVLIYSVQSKEQTMEIGTGKLSTPTIASHTT